MKKMFILLSVFLGSATSVSAEISCESVKIPRTNDKAVIKVGCDRVCAKANGWIEGSSTYDDLGPGVTCTCKGPGVCSK